MNRREDPLLRQHRNRLLQLAEVTNIKPGRGSGKRRGQRQSHGFGPRFACKNIVIIAARNCSSNVQTFHGWKVESYELMTLIEILMTLSNDSNDSELIVNEIENSLL